MSFNIKYFLQYLIKDSRDEVAQNQDVVYQTRNIFATDERYIYIIYTRYMWNSGFHLLWSHITNLHNENLNYGLKVVPKLTYERISLSPYSVMNVRLAAQVLSDSVGNVLLSFCSPDSHGTAKVCLMMDKFFDCMNVRNTS